MRTNRGNALIALSVVIAGIIIAAAVMITNIGNTPVPVDGGNGAPAPQAGSASLDNIKEVTEADHIFGDINAPIKIVEYSDLECPFCGSLHPILEEVVEKYDGQVAWVYRHFPLSSIHADAQALAEGSECVADLAGNDAFWDYVGGVLNKQSVESLVTEAGITEEEFNACIESGKYRDRVLSDAQNAQATGGGGTPWSIVIGPNGEKFELSGAQPVAAWDQVISNILK
ncbi:MAG: protein-disulfide isomerase [Candidatus Paceibacteria bacterium]|jgi:protein-disulfide isomerase